MTLVRGHDRRNRRLFRSDLVRHGPIRHRAQASTIEDHPSFQYNYHTIGDVILY